MEVEIEIEIDTYREIYLYSSDRGPALFRRRSGGGYIHIDTDR